MFSRLSHSVLFAFLFISFISVAHAETNDPSKAFNWQKVTEQHTQGTISRASPISITFDHEIINEDQRGKSASGFMHISPSISGQPVFESLTKIVWTPETSLDSGKEYKVSIKPSGLKGIPSGTAPYQFTFNTIPLEFEIKTLGLSTPPNEKNKVLLKGQLLASDKVNSTAVESVLSAAFSGNKKLPIEWSHSFDGKMHRFTISNITKAEKAKPLTLNWNGKPIDIATSGRKIISIPSANDFIITSTRIIQERGNNPYIQVSFSDELDSKQNLKGLVKLARSKAKTSINLNNINIYPNQNLAGKYIVRLHQGIKSVNGKKLAKKVEETVMFSDIKPQVKFSGKGSILPANAHLEIPFKAVSANAVEVTAFKVFPNNMGQFLQTGNLSGSEELNRTGRFLWRKTIPLTPADPSKWNNYSFNATELMKKHSGSLLRLTLSVRRNHSAYPCHVDNPAPKTLNLALQNTEDFSSEESSAWDGVGAFYADEYNIHDYDWDQRNNPCNDAYFKHHSDLTSDGKNFIASNIGLIAKQDAEGNLHIISTDIRTAEPLTGVDFQVKNYQGQVLASGQSDGSGFAKVKLSGTPFLLEAKKFEDTAYLKLNVKTALSISHFDVGGQKVNKGIKGYIYGERGVWRPGDNIFLTFVLENKGNKDIPLGHPVTMKLIDPQGRTTDTITNVNPVGGFYAFKFKTKEKSETGNWMVKAFVGGSTFSKSLMIETVRPNRLKLELGFNDNAEILYSGDGESSGVLFSQWLHGASASNLKADVSLKFSKKKTKFGKYTDYIFDDPTRKLSSEKEVIIEGKLDDKGYLTFDKNLTPEGNPAGMLKARFTSRVFEKGGAFSISQSSVDFHPYENYVGIKLPKGDATRGMLLTDTTHTVKIASLSAKGEDASIGKVDIELFKISWKWWWDKSSESLAEYADSEEHESLSSGRIETVNGAGEWDFEIKYPQWGRYLIRACDVEGGHCTGKVVYIDWPGWAGRAQEEGSGAASRLNVFSDKPAYSVGDTATIQLPATAQGRALLTVETGSQILEQRWLEFSEATDGKKQFKLPITTAMAPNAYVHISMLQPHKDKKNDRPIRLYGIIPLEVTDIETYLIPSIKVAEEWKPESKQKISVSEDNGRAMNYTLAIVDEGLLGLTAFKTPNLHRHFYSKEALGIKTWDLFDNVVGAYGGKLGRMLALGGGDDAEKDNNDSKERRFPPVVQVLGPFSLAKGATAEHEIDIPAYLGAVRVMVVAANDGAYGKDKRSVFVRQPLMLQASLPRTLGPDEEVSVPVTLFALDKSIKDVTVEIKTDALINVVGNPKTQVTFSKIGEKIAFIKLKTAKKAGKTHLHFVATAMTDKGLQTSEADIYLDIDLANSKTSRTSNKVILPNTTWEVKADAFGLIGTNVAMLELSSVPSLNMEKRLGYLIRYPHGCLEQTTSSIFPQLYLSNVTQLDKKQQQKTQKNIEEGISRLQTFQRASGDFSYWPSGKSENAWASIYAGHFLIEAKKQGYFIPNDLLNNWMNYQVNTAQGYAVASKQYSHIQAYRLYVLALAGQPQMGAMNRLREQGNVEATVLNKKARWLLASAYQRASQSEAANVVISGLLPEVDAVSSPDDSFSSTLGDLGLQLESLIALNKKQDANKLVEQIAAELSTDKFQSTQGISWALMAVSKYLGGDTSSFSASLRENKDTPVTINSSKAISRTKLAHAYSTVRLKNTSGVKLFATLTNTGVPKAGVEKSLNNGLKLYIKRQVRDKKDKKIWHDITGKSIAQGSDVRISVGVENATKANASNIALTIPVAAGMEILSASEQPKVGSKYDYRNLRDDRIHYYFSLKKGEVKAFQIIANATYKGRYYLPAVNTEAMYNGKLQAREKGMWISIADSTAELASAKKDDATEVTVQWHKAHLYNSTDKAGRSSMYLVKGDKAQVLERKTTDDGTKWLFIRFKGKKTIEKWIRAETSK